MRKIIYLLFCLMSAAYVFGADTIVLDKVSIDKDKDPLTKEEKELVKDSLKGKISVKLTPSKNDYVSIVDKGTVDWNLNENNYSNFKVTIPDGTIIKGKNFSQKNPDTEAVKGKDLVFQNCNLVNLKMDATWTIINCNTAQISRVQKSEKVLERDGETVTRIVTTIKLKKGETFTEVSEDEDFVKADDVSDFMLKLNE